jgi:hypothetical protein
MNDSASITDPRQHFRTRPQFGRRMGIAPRRHATGCGGASTDDACLRLT